MKRLHEGALTHCGWTWGGAASQKRDSVWLQQNLRLALNNSRQLTMQRFKSERINYRI